MDDNSTQPPPIKFETSVLQVVLEESEKMSNMTSLILLDEEREENYVLPPAARSELITTYMSLKAISLLITDLLDSDRAYIEDGQGYVLLEDSAFVDIVNAVKISNEGRVLLEKFYNISLCFH